MSDGSMPASLKAAAPVWAVSAASIPTPSSYNPSVLVTEATTRIARERSKLWRRIPSSEAITTAAAPSPTGQHCKRVIAPDIGSVRISSNVRTFCRCAYWLLAPFRWFFRATLATCSAVTPCKCMYSEASNAKWVNGTTAPPSRLSIPAWPGAAPKPPRGLSTPKASTTSERPAATSRHAWATAEDPEAEAFSTCVIGIPVAPRRLSITLLDPIPSRAVPV